jgi:hypothetical protein
LADHSDLNAILELGAQLRAFPERGYVGLDGRPCLHPAALYARSISNTFQSMRELIDRVPAFPDPNTMTEWIPALQNLKGLFLAVDSHVDDLKAILGAAAPEMTDKSRTAHRRQLDNLFEELVGRPFNRVRHNGESLEACCAFGPDFAVSGYFVSAPRADGVVAPSGLAHGSTGTQWSFAVTLRKLLGQLARAARSVQRDIAPMKVAVASGAWTTREASDLRRIGDWLLRCPPYCFPNEVGAGVPDVSIRGDEIYLKLDTLKRLRGVPSGMKWYRTFTTDGVTRQFSVV